LVAAWKRLRVGTQLSLGLGALALVVFAIVGTVLVTTMRGYLAGKLDEQLTKSQVEQSNKMKYGIKTPFAWFSAVFDVRDGNATPRPGGSLPSSVDPLAAVAKDSTTTEVFRTVYVKDEGTYRVRGCPLGPPGQTSSTVLVSAASFNDIDNTVRQLLLVIGAAFILALAVLVFVGRLVMRKGLRPLSAMADTAHDITSRDLAKSDELPVRVSGDGGGVEVDELRTAFNRMLDHIDASLAARTAANERLRQFVADASHELRTPLTSIRGYADLFQYAAANEPAERDAHLAKIREETARMSVLVDDLLLLARLDSQEIETPLRLESTNLTELAVAAAEAFRAAHANHPLRVDLVGDVWLVADPVRLRQVLDNLLANIAAHTPPGTSATIRVRSTDGWAEVSVMDTGPGIPPGHHARIFDRFYRVDDSRARRNGGSGLGLAVVHMLIDAHGGTIRVDSQPGRTVFTVRLPRVEP
jgi:two-component system, OmpR family, sensor kinase